jgi:hypothetical protein
MREERWRIREAAGKPQIEPRPAAPVPPPPVTPPPPPPVAVTAYKIADICRLYLIMAKAEGFKPDQTSSRSSRIDFLAKVMRKVRLTDRRWVMKRADAGRPISDEVAVFVGTGPEQPYTYRAFWDFIRSGGSSEWVVVAGDPETLPVGQLLVSPETLEVIPG